MTAIDIDRLTDAPPEGQAALLSRYYAEFRALAGKVLNGDAALVQMQPTELAHEAAIRLIGLNRIQVRDRTHFLALAARIMRQALLDEVRKARAKKRQAPGALTLWPDDDAEPVDLEALDQAVDALAQASPERARIVELRFFAGLTIEEIALELGESASTIKRRWRAARAWLLDYIDAHD